jgi:hypothetical protein
MTELPISPRGRRLFLSYLIGGGFHRGGVLPFIMYSAFSLKFSDGGKHQEKT